MATPFPFQSGNTLLASQLNAITTLPSTTKTASHTLVIADQGTRVIMNSASVTSVTVDTSIFGAGDIVEIQNIGAGVCTVTAGTATIVSAGPLAIPQNGGGRLIFSSASAATYFPSAVTQSASGLTLISTTTIGTTVASVTVSSAFSATYDNYRILISGGVGSGNQNLNMTLGATATGYSSNSLNMTYDVTTLLGTNGNATTSWVRVGRGDTNNLDGEIELKSPFAAKRTTGQWRSSTSQTSSIWDVGGGFLNDATSYTAFTLAASTGTMTGGTIRVYGYANS